MNSIRVFFLLSILITNTLWGQDLSEKEVRILSIIKELNKVESDFYNDQIDPKTDVYKYFDSLKFIFKKEFTNYCQFRDNLPQQLTDSLTNYGVSEVVSKDHKIQIFTWNFQLGGSARYFDNVYRYNIEDKYHAFSNPPCEEYDMCLGKWITHIESVKLNGVEHYFLFYSILLSKRFMGNFVKPIIFQGQQWTESDSLFRIKDELYGELGYEFDFFEFMGTHGERPIQLIRFDSVNNQFVREGVEDGDPTGQLEYYRFNGKYFEQSD